MGKLAMSRRGAIIVFTPLIALAGMFLAPMEPSHPEVARTAAVAFWMAVWWISGAVHLAVTSLLPLALFPLLGVMDARSVAAQYVNDIIFLYLGGFLVALAMERWDLHRRIALRLLLFFGVQPRRLLLGVMAPSFFLSMWISNTATAMMMFPIVLALAQRIESESRAEGLEGYVKALILAVAYSASVGGTATLIGTPPNLSFARITHIVFPEAPAISFAQWFLFAFPVAFAVQCAMWALFALFYCPRKGDFGLRPALLREQYAALGPMTWEQRCVLAVFAGVAVLWMTRSDLSVGAFTLPGWSNLLPVKGAVQDGTVAIAAALVLFLVPAREKERHLLDWETAKGIPWDIILLFGGGFALASAFAESGLSRWVGEQLAFAGGLHPHVLMLAVAGAMSLMTELTSNTATTELMLPILAALCEGIRVHPLLLMVPATLACSYAFMLPVATPPNAIVFGSRRLTQGDMLRAGLLLNGAAILILWLLMMVLGTAVFGIVPGAYPEWGHMAGKP